MILPGVIGECVRVPNLRLHQQCTATGNAKVQVCYCASGKLFLLNRSNASIHLQPTELFGFGSFSDVSTGESA